jgi:hypothetical protein
MTMLPEALVHSASSPAKVQDESLLSRVRVSLPVVVEYSRKPVVFHGGMAGHPVLPGG